MCVYVREVVRWKVRERKYVVAQGCTYFGMNGLLKEEEMEL